MRIKFILILTLSLSLSLLVATENSTIEGIVPINISLTGYVENPGVYQLTPLNRLSDLLMISKSTAVEQAKSEMGIVQETVKPAQLLSPPKPEKETKDKMGYEKNQGLRSIQIIRNGKTETYDLLKFYRMGDINNNPFLKDGDVVYVPAIKNFVSIGGGINLPGELEFVEGDKISTIIELSLGFTFDADISKLQLYRYKENRIDYDVLNYDLKANPSLLNLPLQADDRILISCDSEIRTRQRIKIYGQVKNPGEYVIDTNTTLYEVLQQAGGLTKRGNIKTMVYYNENINVDPDPYFEMLMQRSLNEMTPLEYSYLRTNLQQLKGKYSIDPVKMMDSEGKDSNPTLFDGDIIYIPEKINMVWVSGQVKNPGMIPWMEGKDWSYYIQAAGGYTNNRKTGKDRIIRGTSGNWVKPNKKVAIQPGDTIFIPAQTDRSLWTDVKDIVTLTSSVVTIILGIHALTAN
ncbi:MAG TPA: SLBB domain-containing protein [Candidatus Cloacimonas sp.]|jgi:protein involved in polysaccharide export with SLBB domain|nr:SLBB domain-containing protein [Candidatus Cloacimonas sp.]MDD2250283.1 SLBB domain-containing protein [Candidatus Cloacimonadota bacterium]MCK9158772.1 SLBB domain-containing protein [Candidatus Cloacimonas sp.]MCK9164976.1 SLBB domain-containing protein [Candidatus Cloacimonas sp.]MDD3734349.1 SLBB domain-containing protein [Candidatus Cloacimonadota bacterium]